MGVCRSGKALEQEDEFKTKVFDKSRKTKRMRQRCALRAVVVPIQDWPNTSWSRSAMPAESMQMRLVVLLVKQPSRIFNNLNVFFFSLNNEVKKRRLSIEMVK